MEERIGPYRLERRLGEGSVGVVYFARRTGDGMAVALKVLRPHLAGDGTFRRRFMREARTASEVHHPNLVAIMDHGEADGQYYLAAEYAEGGSLAASIERRGRLDIVEALAIVTDIAAGLDALHMSGIVHRDVKASNVLLDARGHAALTDFGLAKREGSTSLTQLGVLVGTLAYLAPERIRGAEADSASDIYSLGCLAYECLAGEPPFRGSNMFQLAFAHLQQPPPVLTDIRDDVTPRLNEAIRMALEKEPARRPRSAGAYVAGLGAAASGQDANQVPEMPR